MRIRIANEAEIDAAAAEFLRATAGKRHIAFYAPMGAGKTTLSAAICRVLGVRDDVNSPTFSIINEYLASDGSSIFHFDFYRIEDSRQAMELGLDEYFDSGALCLMEWPENAGEFLPEDTLRVDIRVEEDGARLIEF